MPLMKFQAGCLVMLVLLVSCTWACSIKGAVHRRFPQRADGTKLYMGFGNLGLYRTDGVAVDIICKDVGVLPGKGGTIELYQLMQPTNRLVHSVLGRDTLTKSFSKLEPGTNYQCKCDTNIVNETYSIELHIPKLTPCDAKKCAQTMDNVCYKRVLSPADCTIWNTKLLEIGWNDGLTPDAKVFQKTITGVTEPDSRKIHAVMKTMPQWICHANSDQKFTIDQDSSLENMCKLVDLLNNPANDQYLPQLRTHDNCKSHLVNKPDVSLKYFPMTFDGDPVYLGAVYYVQRSMQSFLLKTACTDKQTSTQGELELECSLYVWKRGASILTADAVTLNKFNGNCFDKIWTIPYTKLGQMADHLNMVACSLYNLVQYKHELTSPFPAVAVPLYRQVEFFIRPVPLNTRASLDPQSNENCGVTIGTEAIAGTVVMTTNGGCDCKASLVACNPIKTEKTMYFGMDKCPSTTPVPTTTAPTTTLTPTTSTLTSSALHTTSLAPATTSSPPSTTSSAPATTSSAPATTSSAPETTTSAPATTSSEPATTSSAHPTTSSASTVVATSSMPMRTSVKTTSPAVVASPSHPFSETPSVPNLTTKSPLPDGGTSEVSSTPAVPSRKPYLLYVAIGVVGLMAVSTIVILGCCIYSMKTQKKVEEGKSTSKRSQSVQLNLNDMDLSMSAPVEPDEFFFNNTDATVASVTPMQSLSATPSRSASPYTRRSSRSSDEMVDL